MPYAVWRYISSINAMPTKPPITPATAGQIKFLRPVVPAVQMPSKTFRDISYLSALSNRPRTRPNRRNWYRHRRLPALSVWHTVSYAYARCFEQQNIVRTVAHRQHLMWLQSESGCGIQRNKSAFACAPMILAPSRRRTNLRQFSNFQNIGVLVFEAEAYIADVQ